MADGILNPIEQLEAEFNFDVYTKQEVDTLLDGKADKVDTYTKTETDALLDDKADADAVYTKTQTDNLLNGKADADSVYTKTETNNLLSAKANSADVYTKTETNNLLSAKADSVNVYTKTEADTLLAGKANVSDVYTKNESNTLLAGKANVDDVYTKTEIDNQLTVTKDGTWVKGTQTTATNLEKLEGGIEYLYGLLSYKYSQLRKYINGNYYDYETDDTSAYTKTVPSGAMPYAGLEQIGGKTVVMNQDFPITTGNWNKNRCSVSVADDVYTLTCTANTHSFFGAYISSSTVISGHKYLYLCEFKVETTNTPSTFELFYYAGNVSVSALNTWLPYQKIYTAPSSFAHGINITLRYSAVADVTVGDKVSVRNAMKIDLTLWFGAGNEPATVEEFLAMYPSYIPYNAGELLSAGVSEVVSKGKNLLNTQRTVEVSLGCTSNTTQRNFAENQVWKGFGYSGFTSQTTINSYSLGDGSVSYNSNSNGYGIAFPVKVKPNTYYTIQCVKDTNSGVFKPIEHDADGYICNKSFGNDTGNVYTIKTTSKTAWIVIGFAPYASSKDTTITISDIMLTESNATSTYVPYIAPATYPIPAEVQALEGYGWSAESSCNVIDYEEKKFIQNIGRYQITGDENIGWYAVGETYCDVRVTMPIQRANGWSCPIFSNYCSRGAKEYGMGWLNANGNIIHLYLPTTITSADDAKTWFRQIALNGKPFTLLYGLATPVETDISAYISDDNLIEVEAGGTLTFPNSNGDDYRIPVPSTEEYMINLQEAVSNG